MKKLTNEEIDKRIEELVGDEYIRLDDYRGVNTKMLMGHNVCGNKYYVRWSNFQQGKRCPRCSGLERLNNEKVDKRIYELVKDEYTRLNEYKNANTKMLIRHNTCGNEYEIVWGSFYMGNRCPKCSGLERLDNEKVDEKICELVKDEYVRLGEYKNNNTKMLMKHNICGNEYLVTWGNFQTGNRCPKCSGKERLDNEKVDKRIYELAKNEYIRLSEYKNSSTKMLMKHNICGNEYEVTWGHFQQGYRCPKCNESKGEKKISNLLESLNIKYTSQKRFKECKYKNTLPFDFYIKNKNIKLLIEFDGRQHYEPVSVFGGDDGFKETQLRDSIKNKFAKDNKIPFLRISYLEEEDVENIVMNKLKELNFIK